MIKRSNGAPKIRRQAGVAAVEFAIVLPVVLLLMLATAELGRAFYQYNTLAKAVRDGARYSSTVALNGAGAFKDIASPEWAAVVDSVKKLVVYGADCGGSCDPNKKLLYGLAESDVSVNQIAPLHVQVTASYTYDSIFPVIPSFGFGAGDIVVDGVVLQAANTMRAL
ncbi:MAG: TadE/TadG family type IV pilus assembly protein [Gammaproteobacteria bacterium]